MLRIDLGGGDVMRAFIFLVLAMGMLTRAGFAHDAQGRPNWIAEGAYRGPDGVHCCGPSDCEQLSSEEVQVRPDGIWLSRFKELVPFDQATPSEDGKTWRCHNYAGERRCFFMKYGSI
jgi:hypothetical protein